MRLIYKRFSIVAGFSILVVVLIINTALTRRQIAVQDSAQDSVQHTQDVLLELELMESLLKDAETGQRGYLYTGDPRYLDPYNSAVSQGSPHLKRLAELTADNPHQQQRIAILRQLKQQKLDELAQTIKAFDAGDKQRAKEIVLSGQGKAIMDRIRSVAGEIRQEERSLEAARLQSVTENTGALMRTLYLTAALAVIGLSLLAFYIMREMRQREKHAAEIREREEWFRVTLASIGDAVIATDEHGTVTFLNSIAEEITGVKLRDAQGRTVQDVFPIFNEQTRQPVENPVAKVLAQGHVMGLANHTILIRADGKVIPIEDSAAPIFDDGKNLRGVVMVFRDVTGEKQAQEVLRKAEKLAAAGRLAATVAHEINNPLEAVGNLIYLVRNLPNLPEEAQRYLGLAEQELDRVSHITRQTLGFYRESSLPTAINLGELLQSVLRLYDNKLKSKGIKTEIDMKECGPVRGLYGELRQLLANIISNAADAVGLGGKIIIRIQPAGSSAGQGVEISIADSGPGIAPEDRPHIFEPFFTTKKDVGTGLGLWVSKEIAERHGGAVSLVPRDTNGLGGAVFTIFLPYSTEPVRGDSVNAR